MTYRPGRYRAGGRHEDEEEVNRRRALRYGGLGRKKEEVRTGFDLDFGERQKAAAHTGVCQRRNVRNSVLGLDRKPLIFENQNRIRSCAAWQSRGAFSILVLVWALSGASVRMGISGVRRSSFAAGAIS